MFLVHASSAIYFNILDAVSIYVFSISSFSLYSVITLDLSSNVLKVFLTLYRTRHVNITFMSFYRCNILDTPEIYYGCIWVRLALNTVISRRITQQHKTRNHQGDPTSLVVIHIRRHGPFSYLKKEKFFYTQNTMIISFNYTRYFSPTTLPLTIIISQNLKYNKPNYN
jgi:hypothetical protein